MDLTYQNKTLTRFYLSFPPFSIPQTVSQTGVGDSNDVWQVRILGGRDGDVVETVTSRLVLYHYIERCVLTTTTKVKLTAFLNL